MTVLPFLTRCNQGDLRQGGITPEVLFGHRPVYDQMNVSSYSLTPEWLGESAFNLAHLGRAELVLYQDLEHFFSQIAHIVRLHDERKYIYAYWPAFDGLAHAYGVGSNEVADHFALLDDAFHRLLTELAGTESAVLLTADHGFIDAPIEHRLSASQLPELLHCLQLPLCGEPRLAYCYVRNGMQQALIDYVQAELCHAMDIVPSHELIQRGLFGMGEPHPELAARVGDYTLVLKQNYVLTQRLPGESAVHMTGFHGGLSPAEVEVPLLLAQC